MTDWDLYHCPECGQMFRQMNVQVDDEYVIRTFSCAKDHTWVTREELDE